MNTENGSCATRVEPVVMPADVRIAIRHAEDALHKIRGFLPAHVHYPLQSAHGKLRVAWVAVDAWESDLRLKAIESKEHDWCADAGCPRCNARQKEIYADI